MTTFVLVHGAWHGGWCWDRLVPVLEAAGHRAIAVDLPIEDAAAGLEAYADSVAAQVAAAGGGPRDGVVAVGHSLGGLVLPLLPGRLAVRRLVYLEAFVPLAGVSMADQFRSSPEPVLLFKGGRVTDEEGRSAWESEEAAARIMYAGLDPADAAWAWPRLRAQASTPQLEPSPDGATPVPAVSVVGTADHVVNPAWSRRVAWERLGGPAVEIDAGHFPMLEDAQLLADTLAAF